MNRLQSYFAFTSLILTTFLTVSAFGATPYLDRASWQAAAGSSQTIDFATTDAGTPISDPPDDVYFEALTLKGATFLSIHSVNNAYIYADENTVLRVNLPANTTSFGADLSPLMDLPVTYTIRLSTGEVFNRTAVVGSSQWDFFGVTSTSPIQWVEFSVDISLVTMDNFSFVIAPSVIQALIDIVPGSQINPVKPNSGDVEVAILSTATFNAMNVNVNTVRFGLNGTEAPAKKYSYRDVNGDRVKDLVLEFKMKDTGIICNATTAKLTGKMKDGKQIQGSGSIKTVNCK